MYFHKSQSTGKQSSTYLSSLFPLMINKSNGCIKIWLQKSPAEIKHKMGNTVSI